MWSTRGDHPLAYDDAAPRLSTEDYTDDDRAAWNLSQRPGERYVLSLSSVQFSRRVWTIDGSPRRFKCKISYRAASLSSGIRRKNDKRASIVLRSHDQFDSRDAPNFEWASSKCRYVIALCSHEPAVTVFTNNSKHNNSNIIIIITCTAYPYMYIFTCPVHCTYGKRKEKTCAIGVCIQYIYICIYICICIYRYNRGHVKLFRLIRYPPLVPLAYAHTTTRLIITLTNFVYIQQVIDSKYRFRIIFVIVC